MKRCANRESILETFTPTVASIELAMIQVKQNLKPSVLFENRLDSFNIAFPFLFILLSITEIFIQKNPLEFFADYRHQTYFFYVFLFSTAHVALTPALLYFLPEIKSLDNMQKQMGSLGIQKKYFIFFALCFLLVLFLELLNIKEISSLLLATLIVGNIWHFISQYQGLFLFYLAKSQRRVFDEVRIPYKRIIYFLIFVTILYQISVQIFGLTKSAYFYEIRLSVFLIEVFSIAYLIYQFKGKLEPDLEKKILLYSLRLSLFPLSIFSLVAGLSVAAVHAVEYVLIYREFVTKTQLEKKPPLYLFSFFCAILNILAYTVVWRSDGKGSIWFALASAIFLAFTFSHFYADSLLFKMKDALVNGVIKKIFGLI